MSYFDSFIFSYELYFLIIESIVDSIFKKTFSFSESSSISKLRISFEMYIFIASKEDISSFDIGICFIFFIV